MAAVVALAAVLFGCLSGCGAPNQPAAPTPAEGPRRPDFRVLNFRQGAGDEPFEAILDGRKVQLLEPDNARKPTAWEGPLKVVDLKTGAHCSAEVSLLTRVYGSSAMPYLIALSYSGSKRYVHYIDVRSCKELWPATTAYTDAIDVASDRVTIQPACECPGGAAPCQCDAAVVLHLGEAVAPVPMAAEARALTRKVLGVEFEGRARVLRPKTPTAALAER